MKLHSALIVLLRFGARQTVIGATVIGLLVGGMTALQGTAFVATYTDQKARTEFAQSLESATALGVLYGEPKKVDEPIGYVVYRVMPVMAVLVAIWSLMTVTKLLRGQEESGQLELINSGTTTIPRSSLYLFMGFFCSLLLSFLIDLLITMEVGRIPAINASFTICLLMVLGIFLPGALFGIVGYFTSQLAVTRRRTLFYGLIPLIIFYAIRAIGNTDNDFYWLKHVSPFGWSDLLSPTLDHNPIWLLPFCVSSVILFIAGLYFSSKRDLGEAVLPESETSKPHYLLLYSPISLALRQNIASILGWTIMSIFLSGLFASIIQIAAKALEASSSLADTFRKIGGGEALNLKLTMLSFGITFSVIIFLLMVTQSLATIRSDEAKGYLDNVLVQPIRRINWLGMRLLLIAATVAILSIICGCVTWFIGTKENVALDFNNILLISIAMTGTPLFLLGIGTLIYGFLPRIAIIGMYAIICWSFILDLTASVAKLNDTLTRTSLFHYVSFTPGTTPDWKTFLWLVGSSIIMIIIGLIAFAKRDIAIE